VIRAWSLTTREEPISLRQQLTEDEMLRTMFVISSLIFIASCGPAPTRSEWSAYYKANCEYSGLNPGTQVFDACIENQEAGDRLVYSTRTDRRSGSIKSDRLTPTCLTSGGINQGTYSVTTNCY